MRKKAFRLLVAGLVAVSIRPSRGQIVGASNHGASQGGAPTAVTSPERVDCSLATCLLLGLEVSPGSANSTVIAANPTNPVELLTGATDYTCFSWLGFYGSNDGGSTWNHTCLSTLGGDLLQGDPALAYGASDIAYIAGASGSLNFVPSVFLESSTDNGATWSAPQLVVQPLLQNGLTNVPSLQVDNSPGSPHANSVYLSLTQFDGLVVQSEISVSHSNDGGNTWTTTTVDPIQIKPIVDQYSRLAIGSDGTVYVAWQRCAMTGPNINCAETRAEMLLSKSTDGGNTWSTPVTIATVNLVPDTCECAFFGNLPLTNEPVANVPVIGIDNSGGPHAGNLYAVMYNWTGTQMKVEVATSADGGDSWSKPVMAAPGAKHDEFFPSLSVSPSGMVGVSWLDRRNDPLNVSYQPFAAISTTGGASFTKSYAVTSYLSDPYLDGNGGTYMGDYTGNTWDTNKFFLVTWPDTRNQQFMEDYVGGFRLK